MTDALRKLSTDRQDGAPLRFPEPPDLRLEDYFLGETSVVGIFQDRWGKLRRQFFAKMNGWVEDGVLHLQEELAYNDGEVEQREWRIALRGDKGYEGTCDGVVGKALGEAEGNVFRWQYDFNLRIAGRAITARFDDAMYLQAGNLLINRVRVSKFGLTLGEATIVFFKDTGDLARAYGDDAVMGEVLQAAAE